MHYNTTAITTDSLEELEGEGLEIQELEGEGLEIQELEGEGLEKWKYTYVQRTGGAGAGNTKNWRGRGLKYKELEAEGLEMERGGARNIELAVL